MVTAMSIAGDLSFNPETDTLTGANGRHVNEIYLKPLKPVAQLMQELNWGYRAKLIRVVFFYFSGESFKLENPYGDELPNKVSISLNKWNRRIALTYFLLQYLRLIEFSL